MTVANNVAAHRGADTSKKLKGFGSSDAELLFPFGNSYELTDALIRRCNVIKGTSDRIDISTPGMELGNDIETDVYQEYIKTQYPDAISNPYHEIVGKYNNFTISNHIDFTFEKEWIELKATKDSIKYTESKYEEQNAHHRMIMRELYEDHKLSLMHYDTSDFYFDPKSYQFNPAKISKIGLDMDDLDVISTVIEKALIRLDEIWDDIPVHKEQEKLILTEAEALAVPELVRLRYLKELEQFAKQGLERMKQGTIDGLKGSNISGIVSPILNVNLGKDSISTRLNSKAVREFHGEDYAQFFTVSPKKGSLTIKVK